MASVAGTLPTMHALYSFISCGTGWVERICEAQFREILLMSVPMKFAGLLNVHMMHPRGLLKC